VQSLTNSLIILAVTAITATHAHAQEPTPPEFYIDIVFADTARIVGITATENRSVIWSLDRQNGQTESLYATPNLFAFDVEPCEDNGVVLLKEIQRVEGDGTPVNHIVLDMRDGKEPVLKTLPASSDERLVAMGVHEKTNSLILHSSPIYSDVDMFLSNYLGIGLRTESLLRLNLDTLDSETINTSIAIHSQRSFVHEKFLYVNGYSQTPNPVLGDNDIYAQNLNDKSGTANVFAPNMEFLDARLTTNGPEILTNNFYILLLDAEHSTIARTLGSVPKNAEAREYQLYLNGMLTIGPDLFYTDVTTTKLVAENVVDVHINGAELFITHPNNTEITIRTNGVPKQLDIPLAHMDRFNAIPFNNTTRTHFFQSNPAKIILIIALLAAITIATLRRRRARDAEE